MSSEKRAYALRVRAERQEENKRRIAAATAELHEEVGPARTTIAEIARRAGVERLTVYNNFPDDADLFAACQQHFLAEHPPPDLSGALAVADPARRVELVLREVYARYERTAPMTENIERDRALLPALDELMTRTADAWRAELAGSLAAALAAPGRPRRAVRAAVALALDFWTWRRLSREGLSTPAAARLMTAAVRAAGDD